MKGITFARNLWELTDDETRVLEREGFEWYPDDINSNDIVIDGDILYYRMAIRTLGRK